MLQARARRCATALSGIEAGDPCRSVAMSSKLAVLVAFLGCGAGTGRGRAAAAGATVLQALSRNSSGSPVSTRLLRLDKIIGQPGVMIFSIDPPGSSPR
jgi:hypothetical protein